MILYMIYHFRGGRKHAVSGGAQRQIAAVHHRKRWAGHVSSSSSSIGGDDDDAIIIIIISGDYMIKMSGGFGRVEKMIHILERRELRC